MPAADLFREELPQASRARVAKLVAEMSEDDVSRLAAMLEMLSGR